MIALLYENLCVMFAVKELVVRLGSLQYDYDDSC